MNTKLIQQFALVGKENNRQFGNIGENTCILRAITYFSLVFSSSNSGKHLTCGTLSALLCTSSYPLPPDPGKLSSLEVTACSIRCLIVWWPENGETSRVKIILERFKKKNFGPCIDSIGRKVDARWVWLQNYPVSYKQPNPQT